MGDLISRTYMKSIGAKCLAYRDEKSGELIAIVDVDLLPSVQPVPVMCKDCVFGRPCFEVNNGVDTDSWIECINPDGLYRDVSCEGYCSASIRRKDENDK